MKLNKEIILQRLKEVKPMLQKKYNLTELALFGSYSRDEQTDESDIDVMVNYHPKRYKDFLYSVDEIEKLFPGTEVQAVIKGGIRPKYFEVIKEDFLYL